MEILNALPKELFWGAIVFAVVVIVWITLKDD